MNWGKLKSLAIVGSAVLCSGVLWGSGYEFEGVGVQEVSRAGAAIANSSNWTAIYWNPANIVKATEGRKKQIGLEVFGGGALCKDSNSLSRPLGPIFSKDDIDSNYVLGALGGTLPLNDKVGFGYGIYTPILQGAKFSDNSNAVPSNHIDFEASAGIVVWNMSSSFAVNPDLSLGAGVNLLYGHIKTDTTITNYIYPTHTLSSKMDGDGWGVEGILGANYALSEKLVLGAVYRTGSDVKVKGDAETHSNMMPDEKSDFKYELRHPPTSGVGVAYWIDPKWSVNFDFTQTYWKRFTSAFNYSNQGTVLANTPKSFNWRNTWKLHLGTDYKLSDANYVMGGYSYDRGALDAGSVDLSTVIDVPIHKFYVGGGHKWNDRWESLLGAVYGYGDRKEGSVAYRLIGWQIMAETRLNF